jgi:hypothetical protein
MPVMSGSMVTAQVSMSSARDIFLSTGSVSLNIAIANQNAATRMTFHSCMRENMGCNISLPLVNDPPSSQPIGSSVIAKLATA